VSPKVRAMVVPGSQAVKHGSGAGKDCTGFFRRGFEWRESGMPRCVWA